MPWTLAFDRETSIVETRYEGVLTAEELVTAATATLQCASEHGTRLLLGDCTTLLGGHSIVDLYGLIDLMTAAGDCAWVREAVILPQLSAPADDVRFWEAACRNRGIDVRVFLNRQAALDWLLTPSRGAADVLLVASRY